MKRIFAAFICLAVFALIFSSCKSEYEKTSRSGIFFDTVVSLTVFGEDDGLLDSCLALCEESLAVDHQLSH